MKKITVKKLIEFREKKSDRTKITFINNLNKEIKKSDDDSGGDYWISCLSAIRNTFKDENLELLDEKINTLHEKFNSTNIKKNQLQFQRNIDIINSFKDFNINNLKPNTKLTFLKQPKIYSILNIKGLPIEAKPCHIYSFSLNESNEVAGIWFIAKLGGFNKSELAMFTDILYRYLYMHYSKDFFVNPDYCIAVDLFNGQEINYTEIQNGNIPILIETTINDIKKINI
ncbi:hypothetical protein [Chryseobacterium lathyri]|uniref:Uncharacterized protein n=1 Tax=Chryseobacterium lathyri TaxID=395933 RepID=A0ABT9SR81_9FLAO|nr:hypothetical protein [Chryseobacterium lathyri]MDP9961753.1 hypothetical protein [Chryseobacterium lathyri]